MYIVVVISALIYNMESFGLEHILYATHIHVVCDTSIELRKGAAQEKL